MKNNKVKSKLIILLSTVICLTLISGCDNNSTENDNSEFAQKTEKDNDELNQDLDIENDEISAMISDTFNLIYTNDYNIISNLEYEDLLQYDIDKFEEIKESFTENLYSDIPRIHQYISSLYFFSTLECNTSIETIDVDVRETDEGKKVCYITMDIELDYVDSIKDIEIVELTATVTVLEVNSEWKFDFININRIPLKNKLFN